MKIINAFKAMIVSKKRSFFVLLIAFLSVTFVQIASAQEYMDISEVQKGMHGVAKTIVLGTEIEEFGVEVLDVLKNQGPAGDLILIRVYGDVINRTGGIANGMSGSPVYINGKLVGAIAYGFKLTDHKTGMITPIKDMLKLWDIDIRNEGIEQKEQEALALKIQKDKEAKKKEIQERKDAEQKKALEASETAKEETKENKEKIEEKPIEDKAIPKEKEKTSDSVEESKPKEESKPEEEPKTKENSETKEDVSKEATPKDSLLQVSGLGESAFNLLSKEMGRYGVSVQQTGTFEGSNEATISYKEVQPGDMIGLLLVRGDINIGSFGTVTHVKDNRILGYGHSFMKRGNCNYILTDAKVYNTLTALDSPRKISSALSALGTATQDRAAGISGKLGVFPKIVPMKINVYDKTLDTKRTFYLQLAHDEELTPLLSVVSTYNAIEKASDRIGEGTAKVKFEINAQDLPVKEFVRENMFYSNKNIGEIAIVELLEGVSILTSNEYNAINIVDIRVDIEVSDEKRTASIVGVKPEKLEVKRGETFEIKVKVKPFRKEEVIYTTKFTVPKDQPLGSMMLNVRGGGTLSLNALLNALDMIDLNKESLLQLLLLTETETSTLKSEINNLLEREQYNDIVVEILELDVDSLGVAPNNKGAKPKTQEKSQGQKMVISMSDSNYDFDSNASFAEIHEQKTAQENKRKFKTATDHIVTSGVQIVVTVVE